MSKLDARFVNEIPQRERAEIIRNDRTSTLIRHAENEALQTGGRYARQGNVVGTGPIAYPRQPAGSFWAMENLPEPPLDGRDCGDHFFDPKRAYAPNCDPIPTSIPTKAVDVESQSQVASPLGAGSELERPTGNPHPLVGPGEPATGVSSSTKARLALNPEADQKLTAAIARKLIRRL